MRPDLKFYNPKRPATLADLQSFERRWELTLPSSYQEFCLKYNGGAPSEENDYFAVALCHEAFHQEFGASSYAPPGVGIANLFSLTVETEPWSLDGEMKLLVVRERVPKNRVPIADDGGGGRYLLSVGPVDFGTLYYWDRERESEYPIAESFKEFINGLTSTPPDPDA